MDTENIIKRINFLLCVLLEGKDDENKLIYESLNEISETYPNHLKVKIEK